MPAAVRRSLAALALLAVGAACSAGADAPRLAWRGTMDTLPNGAVQVTNPQGTATSSSVTLTIAAPPSITMHPVSRTVPAGTAGRLGQAVHLDEPRAGELLDHQLRDPVTAMQHHGLGGAGDAVVRRAGAPAEAGDCVAGGGGIVRAARGKRRGLARGGERPEAREAEMMRLNQERKQTIIVTLGAAYRCARRRRRLHRG